MSVTEIKHKYAVVAEVLVTQPTLFWKPTRQQAEVLSLLSYIDKLETKLEAEREVSQKLFDEMIHLYKRAA